MPLRRERRLARDANRFNNVCRTIGLTAMAEAFAVTVPKQMTGFLTTGTSFTIASFD